MEEQSFFDIYQPPSEKTPQKSASTSLESIYENTSTENLPSLSTAKPGSEEWWSQMETKALRNYELFLDVDGGLPMRDVKSASDTLLEMRGIKGKKDTSTQQNTTFVLGADALQTMLSSFKTLNNTIQGDFIDVTPGETK
jgi:hypothetical protein